MSIVSAERKGQEQVSPPVSPSVRDIRSHFPEDSREKSTAVGVTLYLVVALAWLVSFIAVAVVPGWWWKAALGATSGSIISVLFVIGHDACHGSLTPKGWLNKAIGRLAFLPALHPFTSWDYTHNSQHHSWTNLRGRDPANPPMSKAEYDSLPRWRQRVERLYRSAFGVGLLYFVETWWKRQIFPSAVNQAKMRTPATFQADRFLVFGFLVAEIVALLVLARMFDPSSVSSTTSTAGLILCGVILPYVMWNWLMGFVTFQHHIHPRTRWYIDEAEWSFFKGHLQGTVHVKFPRIVELMLCNIMDHTAHHVDVNVPLYNLKSCQQGLETAYAEEIIVEVWNLSGFFDTMRRCRLYDYDTHRWLDWDGTPTTEMNRII